MKKGNWQMFTTNSKVTVTIVRVKRAAIS